MAVGILTLDIQLSGSLTLKEKRSRLKPLLHRVRREFNVSIAETDYQDKRTEAIITPANVSNDSKYIQTTLNHVIGFIKDQHSNLEIVSDSIELI
jgi:uncharacterized protein YlxP (DUF503 family)